MLKRIATDIFEMLVLIGLVVFGACGLQSAMATDVQAPGLIAVFADGHVRVYPLGTTDALGRPDCFVLLSDGPMGSILGDLECR